MRRPPCFHYDPRRLTSAAAWNVAGSVLPLASGVIAIPHLLNSLGSERFGALALAWALLGYAGLFDLGLSRALTHFTARMHAQNEPVARIGAFASTALALLTIFGLIGGGAIALSTDWLAHQLLAVSIQLQGEGELSLLLLAAALPFVLVTAGLRGILEGQQRFVLVNAIRMPLGVLTFLAPLAAASVSPKLPVVVGSLAGVRVVVFLAHLLPCLPLLSAARGVQRLRGEHSRQLLAFGGWITVSNIVGPLMVYCDRFLIGAVLSLKAVSYYTVPYEIVTRLLLASTSIVGAVFPTLSASLSANRKDAASVFEFALRWVAVTSVPLCLAAFALAHECLEIWVGGDVADNGRFVMQALALGVLCNAFAQVPFAALQGSGRADLTARLHLMELPFYLASFWWLTGHYGVNGAAIAWSLRAWADATVLFALARPRVDWAFLHSGRLILVVSGVAISFAAVAAIPQTWLRATIVLGVVAVAAYYGLLWFRLTPISPQSESALSPDGEGLR